MAESDSKKNGKTPTWTVFEVNKPSIHQKTAPVRGLKFGLCDPSGDALVTFGDRDIVFLAACEKIFEDNDLSHLATHARSLADRIKVIKRLVSHD